MKGLLRPRYLLPALAGLLLLHLVYLYYKVGNGLSREAMAVPSILYGRPAEVRAGDHVDNLRLIERLKRLSYRKVKGPPSREGSYAEETGMIRIFPRRSALESVGETGPVDITLENGRVMSLATPSGAPVRSFRLEPEEIGRIVGPQMETRRVVPLSAVPRALQDAVIAAEDSRFHTHGGLDFLGIARALWANIRERRFVQGGSTITQQVAKNFFLTPRKTLLRKLREAELALVIERRHSKREILEAYLNKIYLGQEGARGIYGVEEAARFYFSKGVSDLSLEESALLAGIIRSPNRYSPLRMPAAARERRNWVLGRMRQLGMLDAAPYRAALKTPIRLSPRKSPVNFASYFIDYIQRASAEVLGEEELTRSGHRFHTTLDPMQQAAAEAAVSEGLAELDRSDRNREDPLQAALVALDPATGEMTAMVGGRGYGDTQFNRAADARRQPGSAFKPFILLAAMEQAAAGKSRTTLASYVSGEPVSIEDPRDPEGMWMPANNEGKVYGTLTVRRIVEESVNTAAVRLAMETGLRDVVVAARQAGITGPLLPVPAAALGTYEVTPVELAYAYATFASQGTRFMPFALRAIVTEDGETIHETKGEHEPAVDPRAAYLVTSALAGVLDRGTAYGARAAGFRYPAAGKTGTTDEYRDSWFAGYTPDLVCVVWVGRDSGKTTRLTGAAGALKIWTRFMKSVYRAVGPRAFEAPPGIITAVIDPESGFRATSACPKTITESFLDGLAPTERCPLHPANPVTETLHRGVQGIGDFFRNLFR